MNSQGYTKDNIHKGNTKIVAGGIDVDGLIRIGDQSAGGDGYVLPETKGTIGQVITMNADNTTSFQDVGGDVATGRLVQNFFQMTNPTTAFSPSNFIPLYTNKNGSDIITTADIEVGSSVRFRSKGYLFNGNLGQTAFGQFRLRISVPNTSSTFDFYSTNQLFIRDVGMSAGTPNIGRGWWEINVTITKINASNDCNIGVSGLYNCVASTGVTSDTFDIQFYDNDTTFTSRLPNSSSSNQVIPAPFWSALPSTFQVELAWKQIAFDACAIPTEYTIDYLNTGQEVLATTTAPATDHNSLANLNVGDPHQLYAFLGGRSGGQVLSGGITPANFLTLKSHTAGANNIVVKDLNTTFEKNLQIGTNQILDTLNNSIDFIGGDMNLLNTSLTNRIVVASQNNIDILATNQIQLSVPNLSNNIIITSTDTSLNQALNMNNNNINNVLNINSGTNINLNPTGFVDCNGDIDMGSNRIIGVPEIVGDGTNMTIRNGGGISILLDQATNKVALLNNNLEMNNNNIDNVNNVISSGTLSLESSGGGGQSIQLDGTFITFFQGGGSFVPTFTASAFDMNNGGINNVGSINGFSPQGGIFAGTADSLTLTASTAEQSIFPTAFVGTLAVPPNGFNVGDSFHLVLAGDFSSQNGDTINIRLYGGPTSTILLADLAVPLVASAGVSFEVEVDFQLRNIGIAGVADICSNFDFTYNGGAGGAFRGERGVFQNNTTFDTTIVNTLLVTAQFSTNNANNSIKTLVSKLSKTF